MKKLAYCVCEKKGANKLFTCTLYILVNVFLFVFTCKITSNQKIIISWVSIYFLKQNTHISEISKSFKVCCDLRIFYIINLITVYIVICTAFFALNAKPKILCKIIANTNELQHIPVYFIIFTFPLRVLKRTFTFAIVFILHEQHRFTRRHMAPMDARHLGVPTSRPSNNVFCLLTLTSYHHDVKRGDLAHSMFQNLRYD